MSTVLGNPIAPVVVRLRPFDLSDEQFAHLCRANPDLRFERSAQGEILIMPPAGGEAGRYNALVTAQAVVAAERGGDVIVLDSSTGFRLPSGAVRSPDTAWVRRSRWQQLTAVERKGFLPLCPDFVIEIVSPSDRLNDVQAKMREWIDNGCQLGWLLDPEARQVYVYRPGAEVQRLDDPATVSADPIVGGFTLDLTRIFGRAE